MMYGFALRLREKNPTGLPVGDSQNWTYYDCHKDVATKPWFIEKVDDNFDCTYCDIYVKISSD